jgi:large subunit ribosomal protein L25
MIQTATAFVMAEDQKEQPMSDRLKLSVDVREKTGKNANRKLRAKGVIPGVFYTGEGLNFPVQANEAALMKLYGQAGRVTVFDLEINDKGATTTHPCIIWDVEYYPTRNRFQHVDFYGVHLDKELKVKVPLEFLGTAKGTKLGGRLEVYREQLYIYSKPATLPRKITVDISDLDVGQGLRVADLAMPEGVRADYDTNFAILTVNMPGGKDEAEEA